MLHLDGIVYKLLKACKSVTQQLILDGSTQAIPEVILLVFIICNICWGLARQLNVLVSVFSH